ncbi:transmembrane adaptor Erv26 [Kalaharituber pfeilii]|nr:transmembrane adaptor Erv26 [Kalaharituber pfeilii]
MWILPFVGYLGIILGFCFLTLAIASGLYYLSELVEEHTVLSKKVLTRLIQSIIVVHILLVVFDGFPILLTLFSAASHGVYMLNLRKFPVVKLSDGVFIASCLAVIANHLLWFRHFSIPPEHLIHQKMSMDGMRSGRDSPLHDYSSSDPYYLSQIPKFREISAFFGICVWLIPFSLFVSLTAGENVLPSTTEIHGQSVGDKPHGKNKRGGPGMAKMVVDSVKDWFANVGETFGWTGDVTSRRRFD